MTKNNKIGYLLIIMGIILYGIGYWYQIPLLCFLSGTIYGIGLPKVINK